MGVGRIELPTRGLKGRRSTTDLHPRAVDLDGTRAGATTVVAVIRHVALFRWVEGTSAVQQEKLSDALAALPSQISAIRTYHFGPDAGLRDANWDYAVVADFDDTEGWRTYTDDPQHQRVLHDVLTPMVADRAAVQYEI